MSNFPIRDPDLAQLSELLHRMTVCKTNAPVHWMASEAITHLQRFVEKRSDLTAPCDAGTGR